jgi:hypothetical protein
VGNGLGINDRHHLCANSRLTTRSESGSSSGMAFLRQSFGSRTADDYAEAVENLSAKREDMRPKQREQDLAP